MFAVPAVVPSSVVAVSAARMEDTICMRTCRAYLIVRGPEACDSAVVGVGWEDGLAGAREGVVEVLHDEYGLGDGLAAVEEHGDLLVDGVGGEKQLALVGEVLLHVLIIPTASRIREDEPPPSWDPVLTPDFTTRHFIGFLKVLPQELDEKEAVKCLK
ncbi:hypothetical protein EJB05_15912, partial [Eragrostis curvula]